MGVFISTTTFATYDSSPLALLKRRGVKYTLNPFKRKLTENEIRDILKVGSYIGLIAGTEPLTEQVMKAAESLKVISRVGVGLDNVELAAAKKLNIEVYNTPDVLTDSVAELTMTLILCSLRKITSMCRNMSKEIWHKEMGLMFKGKTLGIIGYGRIGKRVAQLSQGFGVRVIFYDIKSTSSNIADKVSLDELLKRSDIISIHSSAKETLISKEEISKMKKGLILINTSRGSVIDEEGLYEGLCSGKIGCAALDVYKEEPYSGKLLTLGNVICTPHVGSYAKEARIEMELQAVKNLIKGLKIDRGLSRE